MSAPIVVGPLTQTFAESVDSIAANCLGGSHLTYRERLGVYRAAGYQCATEMLMEGQTRLAIWHAWRAEAFRRLIEESLADELVFQDFGGML